MKSSNVLNQQNQDSLMFFESELFKKVQIEALYPDSKIFADAIPKVSYGEILAQYQLYIKNQSSVNLEAFIDEYFTCWVNTLSAYADRASEGKILTQSNRNFPESAINALRAMSQLYRLIFVCAVPEWSFI